MAPVTVTVRSADEVRAAIATYMLGENVRADLGDVTLHRHQVEGVRRITRLLAEHGGALLADDVGLGKTYVALAVARTSRNPLVVAPAALRSTWMSACEQARVAVRFISVESLSRCEPHIAAVDLVIVDEAHHLRSSSTLRYAAACTLCRSCKVLLMTATPIQNRLDDLRIVLALFLGERAHALTQDELIRYVVRRFEGDIRDSASVTLPRVQAAKWISISDDVDCLDRIVALPPPVPPKDAGDGGVLLTYTLVRQWASSRSALRGALQRRLAHARAMQDALLAGRVPTRDELRAWCFADGAQQLSFPELAVAAEARDGAALLMQIEQHTDAVRELFASLAAAADPDVARAAALRALLDNHSGERVVAFSEYADTVRALYRALAPNVRTALLTHGGGRVAGGPVTRAELVARFAPGDSSRAAASDRIDLLLTTDVLSEGVNLQDASVVVHLDLSWNPARMEQRVGRLRRIGAARDSIAVYALAPPAPAERMLELDRRLRAKLGVAAKAVGIAGTILPGFTTDCVPESTSRQHEQLASALQRWTRLDARGHVEHTVGAAVRAPYDCALACVRLHGAPVLMRIDNERVMLAHTDVLATLEDAGAADAPCHPWELEKARALADAWLRQRAVSDVIDLAALRVARSRRAVLHRVEAIAQRSPRHTQSRLAPLMHAARCAAAATLSAGAERVLDELASAPLSDGAWLQAVGEFATLHARDAYAASDVLAILLLRSTEGHSPSAGS